jgi:hypothetical protein
MKFIILFEKFIGFSTCKRIRYISFDINVRRESGMLWKIFYWKYCGKRVSAQANPYEENVQIAAEFSFPVSIFCCRHHLMDLERQ